MRSRMTFRSITLTALCCMLACILMITGILSDSFTKKMTNELAVEASYLARGMASQTAGFSREFPRGRQAHHARCIGRDG